MAFTKEIIDFSELSAEEVQKKLTELNIPLTVEEALKIQNGGPEFCNSKEWLNIWWPHDEYMFIKMGKENKLNDNTTHTLM